jgi:hypothetical protein
MNSSYSMYDHEMSAPELDKFSESWMSSSPSPFGSTLGYASDHGAGSRSASSEAGLGQSQSQMGSQGWAGFADTMLNERLQERLREKEVELVEAQRDLINQQKAGMESVRTIFRLTAENANLKVEMAELKKK